MPEYLTTKELAEMLRIKERKVYDLAAAGEVPCSKAMGKLLFPRDAVEAWLARNSSGIEGLTQAPLPTVFLGSHDPLLEWSLRESGSGIASFFDGSLDGLDRFANAEGIATGLHIFDREAGEWNVPAVRRRFANEPVVLLEWAWRERGLIVASGNPKKVEAIGDLDGLRVVPRQAEAGSQVLLDYLVAEAGLEPGALQFGRATRTETDAALAVLEGQADAAFGLASVAKQYRLDFVPIVRERFDLLVWRRDWFEEPLQQFLEFCRRAVFEEHVRGLTGYDTSGLGRIHFNGN